MHLHWIHCVDCHYQDAQRDQMWMVGQMLVKVQLLCVQHGLRLAWEWLPLQSHLHYPRPFILLQKRKAHSSPPYQERHDSLILNVDSAKKEGGEVLIYPFLNPGGEGILCPPFHIFAYYCANTRASTLKKLDFSYLWVWERALRFLPHEIISFSKKNKFHQKKNKISLGGTLTNWAKRLATNKGQIYENIFGLDPNHPFYGLADVNWPGSASFHALTQRLAWCVKYVSGWLPSV